MKATLDGTRSLTVKEAAFALAPTLERMKKRGFDAQEIAEKLHEKGIDVKPPTLAKYLNEFRREKDGKRGTPPAPVQAEYAECVISLKLTDPEPSPYYLRTEGAAFEENHRHEVFCTA